jgi:hypothetical protein
MGVVGWARPLAGYQMVVTNVRSGSSGSSPLAGVIREWSTNVSVITPTAKLVADRGDGFEAEGVEQPAKSTTTPPRTATRIRVRMCIPPQLMN